MYTGLATEMLVGVGGAGRGVLGKTHFPEKKDKSLPSAVREKADSAEAGPEPTLRTRRRVKRQACSLGGGSVSGRGVSAGPPAPRRGREPEQSPEVLGGAPLARGQEEKDLPPPHGQVGGRRQRMPEVEEGVSLEPSGF